MELASGDTDFSAHAELAAVGELGRAVHHQVGCPKGSIIGAWRTHVRGWRWTHRAHLEAGLLDQEIDALNSKDAGDQLARPEQPTTWHPIPDEV